MSGGGGEVVIRGTGVWGAMTGTIGATRALTTTTRVLIHVGGDDHLTSIGKGDDLTGHTS